MVLLWIFPFSSDFPRVFPMVLTSQDLMALLVARPRGPRRDVNGEHGTDDLPRQSFSVETYRIQHASLWDHRMNICIHIYIYVVYVYIYIYVVYVYIYIYIR